MILKLIGVLLIKIDIQKDGLVDMLMNSCVLTSLVHCITS